MNLDELEALAQAATPGPWEVDPDPGQRDFQILAGEDVIVGGCGCCGSPFTSGERNPAFIAAANPATVLALIERVRALEALVEQTARSAFYEGAESGSVHGSDDVAWESSTTKAALDRLRSDGLRPVAERSEEGA